jgi:hypothetical protein
MSKGIGNVEYIRQGSEVAVQGVPFWSYLYTASTTKSAKWNIGDRVVTPDGRVFRYSLAAGTVNPEVGACVNNFSITNAVAPAQVAPTSPNIWGITNSSGQVGDYCVTLTVASGDGIAANGAIAADEMRGGYVVINNGSTQHPQRFGILGNDAVAAGGGSMNVYLDGPIGTIIIGSTSYTGVVVGTTTIEAYLNPYGNVYGMDSVNSAYVTCIGIPNVRATVGQYFWLQTWGPCWITSDNNTGKAANGRDIYVVSNGSVVGQTGTTYAGYQRIGTGVDKSASGTSNGPLVMLQIAP